MAQNSPIETPECLIRNVFNNNRDYVKHQPVIETEGAFLMRSGLLNDDEKIITKKTDNWIVSIHKKGMPKIDFHEYLQ